MSASRDGSIRARAVARRAAAARGEASDAEGGRQDPARLAASGSKLVKPRSAACRSSSAGLEDTAATLSARCGCGTPTR